MGSNRLIEKLRDLEALRLSERVSFSNALALWLVLDVTRPSFVNTARMYPRARYEDGELTLFEPLAEYHWRKLRDCFTDKDDLDAVDRLYLKSLEVKNTADEVRELYKPILYLNRYLAEIVGESSAEFDVDMQEGSIYDITDIHEEDRDMAHNCREDYEALGFYCYDRAIYTKRLKKVSPDIKGEWLRLVEYKGWIMRAVWEENGRYLLIADVRQYHGEKLGMVEVPDTSLHLKWVEKDECGDMPGIDRVVQKPFSFGALREERI